MHLLFLHVNWVEASHPAITGQLLVLQLEESEEGPEQEDPLQRLVLALVPPLHVRLQLAQLPQLAHTPVVVVGLEFEPPPPVEGVFLHSPHVFLQTLRKIAALFVKAPYLSVSSQPPYPLVPIILQFGLPTSSSHMLVDRFGSQAGPPPYPADMHFAQLRET